MRRFSAGLLCVLVSLACSPARDASRSDGSLDGSLHVPLRYVAAGDVHVDAVSWVRLDVPVAIENVIDSRAQPGRIGESTADRDRAVPIFEEPAGSAPQVAGNALARQLQSLGVKLVGSGAEAQRTLRVSLIHLWVQEDNTYNAEVRFNVQVLGPGGAPLGSVLVSGSAKRFGATLSRENYNEAWSSAFGDALENLIEDLSFAQAMSATAAPTPVVPRAPAP